MHTQAENFYKILQIWGEILTLESFPKQADHRRHDDLQLFFTLKIKPAYIYEPGHRHVLKRTKYWVEDRYPDAFALLPLQINANVNNKQSILYYPILRHDHDVEHTGALNALRHLKHVHNRQVHREFLGFHLRKVNRTV